jgi:formamidopyrimidine-DNA glycosylase
MPSLPELEVYKAQFTRELIGHAVTRLDPLDWRVVRADLKQLEQHVVGHPLKRIDRYGKWLIFDVGAAEQLILHLGLIGRLELLGPEATAPRHSVFSLHFDDGRRLVMSDFRGLGRIYWQRFEDIKLERELGPDLLSIDKDYFVTTLRRKRRGARDVLMDQKIIAGIGGKYADEILFQARLHPNTKLDKLDPAKLAELYDITLRVTREAIALGADVERFPSDWLIPHRRTDKHCPNCGSELSGRTLGGSETFYCPVDQPVPMPFRSG